MMRYYHLLFVILLITLITPVESWTLAIVEGFSTREDLLVNICTHLLNNARGLYHLLGYVQALDQLVTGFTNNFNLIYPRCEENFSIATEEVADRVMSIVRATGSTLSVSEVVDNLDENQYTRFLELKYTMRLEQRLARRERMIQLIRHDGQQNDNNNNNVVHVIEDSD